MSIFFVQHIDSSASDYIYKVKLKNGVPMLESDEVLTSVDLICEGPIEGLVDKEGYNVKYLEGLESSSIVLGKGVYYDDVPILDSKLSKFNFTSAGVNISYGEETSYADDFPSTVFRYNKKIYLSEKETLVFYDAQYIDNQGIASILSPAGVNIKEWASLNYDPNLGLLAIKVSGAGAKKEIFSCQPDGGNLENNVLRIRNRIQNIDYFDHLVDSFLEHKENSHPFTHKIKNKYCDLLKVQISIDELFTIDQGRGDIRSNSLLIMIQLQEIGSYDSLYLLAPVTGVCRGGQFLVDIPFHLKLDVKKEYMVSVWSLNKKIEPEATNSNISFSIASIVEAVRSVGSFSYPKCALVKTSVSSKHFKNDPDRTYDLKLKKIKVPNNYDCEAKEYSGFWDGVFDPFLRWTDNPAWIFFDICTNPVYGAGNTFIEENKINKWDLYRIANYCDYHVKTNSTNPYTEDDFITDNVAKGGTGSHGQAIYITKQTKYGWTRSLDSIKQQYKPLSLIYLYDIKNFEGIDLNLNCKKIVWSIEEGVLNDDNSFTKVSTDNGTHFKLFLINDFGPKRVIENNSTGNVLKEIKRVHSFNDEDVLIDDNSLTEKIARASRNSYKDIKQTILNFFTRNVWSGTDASYIQSNHVYNPIFPSSSTGAYNPTGNKRFLGKCVPQVSGYEPFLEPRFSANIYVDSEVECLKLLNDLASVFRGMTYYKNNFISSTVDVDKGISYLFTNSNVKDGVFNYSSGSLDGNYSVAKVFYKDSNDIFRDAVEIVEDAQLIRDYGIIIKEILGFGITSRGQAKRIGEWMLATNKFENQTVGFVTDMQGLKLKPSDIIQIKDVYKNSLSLQGRISEVNNTGKYFVVDRKLKHRLTGKTIRVSKNKNNNDLSSVENSGDYDKFFSRDYFEFYIDRIDNQNNRVYVKSGVLDYDSFEAVIKTSPFIININNEVSDQELYKVISIGEEDNNSYSFFCVKHDPHKYESIDNGSIDRTYTVSDKAISFSYTSNVKPLDFSGIESNYYEIEYRNYKDVFSGGFDFSFNDSIPLLDVDSNDSYGILSLNFTEIYNQIKNSSSEYYSKVEGVIDSGGGFIVDLSYKTQSLKIKIPYDDMAVRKVFLGSMTPSDKSPNMLFVDFQIYLYNNKNQIVKV